MLKGVGVAVGIRWGGVCPKQVFSLKSELEWSKDPWNILPKLCFVCSSPIQPDSQ